MDPTMNMNGMGYGIEPPRPEKVETLDFNNIDQKEVGVEVSNEPIQVANQEVTVDNEEAKKNVKVDFN